MSKRQLEAPLDQLERDIIETLIAGLHEWRPDLDYPESHSDMQGAVRALLRMYEVRRRPIALAVLPYHCDTCRGRGRVESLIDGDVYTRRTIDCPSCKSSPESQETPEQK